MILLGSEPLTWDITNLHPGAEAKKVITLGVFQPVGMDRLSSKDLMTVAIKVVAGGDSLVYRDVEDRFEAHTISQLVECLNGMLQQRYGNQYVILQNTCYRSMIRGILCWNLRSLDDLVKSDGKLQHLDLSDGTHVMSYRITKSLRDIDDSHGLLDYIRNKGYRMVN